MLIPVYFVLLFAYLRLAFFLKKISFWLSAKLREKCKDYDIHGPLGDIQDQTEHLLRSSRWGPIGGGGCVSHLSLV